MVLGSVVVFFLGVGWGCFLIMQTLVYSRQTVGGRGKEVMGGLFVFKKGAAML